MAYLRMTVAEWDINLDSAEAVRLVDAIAKDGVRVFRRQPGFVSYRLMRAGDRQTVAVAEWHSQQEAETGSAKYREWMQTAGVRAHITLDTQTGPIIVSGDA